MKHCIRFFSEVEIKVSGYRSSKSWIIHVLEGFQQVAGNLCFILVNDEGLLKLNQQYLQHDTFTDIITFDYSEKEGDITGDIYISIDRVLENASERNLNPLDELQRVMVHGVLHLIGFNDKTPAQKKKMRAEEDYWLNLPDAARQKK